MNNGLMHELRHTKETPLLPTLIKKRMHCNLLYPLNDLNPFLKCPVKRFNENHLALHVPTEKEQIRLW